MSNFPQAVPELFGDSFRLRELIEDDIPSWFERATDVESADLAGDPVPESIGMGLPWLQKHRDRFRGKRAIRWAILPAGSTVSVGTVGLAIKADEAGVGELGIVIARAHWGKGLGTSAANLVARYAFATLGLREIQAEVLGRNLACLRLLEKNGFHLVRAIPPTDTEPEELLLYAKGLPLNQEPWPT